MISVEGIIKHNKHILIVSGGQFGAVNQQDCVNKCSQLFPALTSQGMIGVRRIKQVSTIF